MTTDSDTSSHQATILDVIERFERTGKAATVAKVNAETPSLSGPEVVECLKHLVDAEEITVYGCTHDRSALIRRR